MFNTAALKLKEDLVCSYIHDKEIIWAASRENVPSNIFDQVSLKPVCSATATS